MTIAHTIAQAADLASIGPLLVVAAQEGGPPWTLLGGICVAAVAVYLARSNKDSLSVKTALEAVAVAKDAVALLKDERDGLRLRVTKLEGEIKSLAGEIRECRRRLERQKDAIRDVGGAVSEALDEEDAGDD